jgi:hypothetical protein
VVNRVDIPRPSKLIRNVDPHAPEWVCQLADLLLDTGAEKNATIASSSARSIARIPQIGKALRRLTSGILSLRAARDTDLTPAQSEILSKVLNALIENYSETVSSVKKQSSS